MKKYIVGQISFNDSNNFWIYNLDQPDYTKIINYNETSDTTFITCQKDVQINIDDIVIVYVKGKQGGFYSVGKTGTNCEFTNGYHNIFTNKSKNNFSIELSPYSSFEKPIKFSYINNVIKEVTKKTKSIPTNGTTEFHKLDFEIGKKIIETMLLSINDDSSNDDGGNDNNSDNVANSADSNNINNEDKITKTIIQKIDELSDPDSDEENEENEDKSNDPDSETEQNESGHKIPVMISPCDDFECPENEKELSTYFYNHFLTCSKCDITNNNNTEISRIFTNARYTIFDVDGEDGEYENMLNSYYNSKKYKIDKKSNKPEIRILKITDDTCLYDGCFLIGWNDS
jgi:hypothetical protein